MTVLEVIQRSTEFLSKKGVEAPRLQIELMLAHVLKMPRLNLYLQFNRPLNEADLAILREMVARRGERVPVQHLLGSTSFCGFELAVSKDVLVPRPETEILAERGWIFMNSLAGAGQDGSITIGAQGGRCLHCLDFGTGSGCLAIAIASHAAAARVVAIDASERALAIAKQNTEKHGLSDRIEFYQGNGVAALPSDLHFDLIVSNPPYIPTEEIKSLPPEVRDHDPRQALDGGPDGLDFYRMFAAEAGGRLHPDGKLMIEFGDHQERAVRKTFEEAGWTVDAIEPDLSRQPRFLIARAPGIRKE